MSHMRVLRIARAGSVHPFGDERTVTQAFPSGIPEEEADPFLMCDNFAFPSEGPVSHPDSFPVDWHPHRGMDILSYLKTGLGRHGDSMGNRETFKTPGMQWISCGSGIEHAEGGGTPKGEIMAGFQIWINVPASKKMDDPRYGTEPPEAIPQTEAAPGAMARLLAGEYGNRIGQFKTSCEVQMIDFELEPGARLEHTLPLGLDTCMLYCYEGAGKVATQPLGKGHVALLDASADGTRSFVLEGAGAEQAQQKMQVMLFAGKKLREPIAWHGPIVMNTQAELRQTFAELRQGTFPPKRVSWDYRRIASRPTEKD